MKRIILILLLFTALTGIMTYPLIFKMNSSIAGDLGDPLLSMWTIDWNIKKFFQGYQGLWDANYFYPHKLTLAFSEPFIGIAVFGIPAMLATNNIVFVYNILFLFSFVMAGLGAYLLVFFLLKDYQAAIIGGLIYAFGSYRFYQSTHMHMLYSQWIPFCLLFLHLFFEKGNIKHLLLFSLFYLLQFTSSLHIGYFLTVTIIFFVVFYSIQKKIKNLHFYMNLSLVLVISWLAVIYIFYPYITVKKEYGLNRNTEDIKQYSAHIESYITRSETKLYGKLTGGLWHHGGIGGHEKELFTGFAIPLLIFAAVYARRKRNTQKTGFIRALWKTAVVLFSALILVFVLDGGKPVFFLNREILNLHAIKPVTCLITLLLARFLLDKGWRHYLTGWFLSIDENMRFYLVAMATFVLLSFGPRITFLTENSFPGPYALFFHFIPGFNVIRVPARFMILILLCCSVLAPYGFIKLKTTVKSNSGKNIFALLLSLFILAENTSIPLSTSVIESGANIPSVYRWLSSEPGDCAIIELPMHMPGPDYSKESLYNYYSIYHGKRILNGYSSFVTPTYDYFSANTANFPDKKLIGRMKEIKLKYIIVHSDKYAPADWKKMKEGLDNLKDDLIFTGKFGNDFVYRIPL